MAFYPRSDEADTLNPGLLRHQITWQSKGVSVPNSFGEDVFTWNEVLVCRAQIRSLYGRELAVAQQRWADAQYQVLQHFAPGLTRGMRIAWYINGANSYLDVLDVQDPPGTGRYQIIIAREWVA